MSDPRFAIRYHPPDAMPGMWSVWDTLKDKQHGPRYYRRSEAERAVAFFNGLDMKDGES